MRILARLFLCWSCHFVKLTRVSDCCASRASDVSVKLRSLDIRCRPDLDVTNLFAGTFQDSQRIVEGCAMIKAEVDVVPIHSNVKDHIAESLLEP